MVEQRPFKPKVVGSIPTAPTDILRFVRYSHSFSCVFPHYRFAVFKQSQEHSLSNACRCNLKSVTNHLDGYMRLTGIDGAR